LCHYYNKTYPSSLSNNDNGKNKSVGVMINMENTLKMHNDVGKKKKRGKMEERIYKKGKE